MAKKSKVELIEKVDKILDELLDAMSGYSAMECYDVLQALKDEIDNDAFYHKCGRSKHITAPQSAH